MTSPSRALDLRPGGRDHRVARWAVLTAVLFGAFQALDALRVVAGLGSGADPVVGVDLGARAQAVAATALQPLSGPDVVRGPSIAEVVLAHPSLAQRLGLEAGSLAASALVVTVGVILYGLVRCAERGDLFSAGSVRRVQAVAIVVAVGGQAQQVVAGAGGYWASAGSALRDSTGWSVSITLTPLLVGATLLVIAEIWARAVRLREETEGLV